MTYKGTNEFAFVNIDMCVYTYSNDNINEVDIKPATIVAPKRLPLKATNAPPQNAPVFTKPNKERKEGKQ